MKTLGAIFICLWLSQSVWAFQQAANNYTAAIAYTDSAWYLIHEELDLLRAQQLNKLAAAYLEKEPNAKLSFKVQLNQGFWYVRKKQNNKALATLEKLEKTKEEAQGLKAKLHFALARTHWNLSDYAQCQKYAAEAAQTAKELEDWQTYVDASMLIIYSIYYAENSNFDRANALMNEVYAIAHQHLPKSRIVFKYIYQLAGKLKYQEALIDEAIEITLQGLYIEQELIQSKHPTQDSTTLGNYMLNLAKMYTERKDYEQALAYFYNAANLYKQLKNIPKTVKTLKHIADILQLLGNRTAAHNIYKQIYSYAQKIPNDPAYQHRHRIFKHLSISYYYLHFQDFDAVIDYYSPKRLAYIEQHELDLDDAYSNLGRAYEQKGLFVKAGEYYKKALDYELKKYGKKGKRVAKTYFKLGVLADENGQENLALSYLDSVLAVLHSSHSHNNGEVISFEDILDKSVAVQTYNQRGNVLMGKEELLAAHQDFENVISLANYLKDSYSGQESKLLSLNSLRPTYENAILTSWQLYQETKDSYYKDAIFNYIEHSKSTLLNENILKFRNQYQQGGAGIPDSLLEKEEALMVKIDFYKEKIIEARHAKNQPKIAKCKQQLLHLEQQLEQFEQELLKQFPNYRSWDHGRDSLVLPQEVQKYLSPESVFIQYFISNQQAFIIYITQEDIKIKTVDAYEPVRFKRVLRELRHALSDISFVSTQGEAAYAQLTKNAWWLYQHFLDDPILEGKKELIIVPDNHLHYIPFEILLTAAPTGTSQNYKSLDYLIKKYKIRYEYSASLMANTQTRLNTQSGKILGFAPRYNNQINYDQLSRSVQKTRSKDEMSLHNLAMQLKGTKAELNFLKENFKGDYVYDEEAGEHNFKEMLHQQDYSILHLAMHGLVDHNHPAYSSLMFTENLDSLEDNLLYTYEINHLDGQRANMVVLSACKTGYGRYEQGEGIISIGRGFMYAGIPSVMMTLWELNDQSSVHIIDYFYHNLADGMDKTTGLQQAKLYYLEQAKGLAAHPFFWSSFVLMGNPQPITIDSLSNYSYWYWILCILGLGSVLVYVFKKNSPS